MDTKHIGDIGESCCIGKLAELGVLVATPLSDNLPFDFIIIYKNKLLKCQVKTASAYRNGAINFDLRSHHTSHNTKHTYDETMVDCFMLYSPKGYAYILGPEDFVGRTGFVIRVECAKNNQKGNAHDEYVVTRKRLDNICFQLRRWPNGKASV